MSIEATKSGSQAQESSPPDEYRARLVDGLLDELLEQLSGLMIVGPRAAGKTTTISRRAKTTIRLDQPGQAAAFEADPDAALRALEEPVLLDEWQAVPEIFGAARRAIEADPRPNRLYLTGSVLADQENQVYPGTGRIQRLEIFPMTVRELIGNVHRPTFFDRVVAGEELIVPKDPPDLRGYLELALRSGFPAAALRLSGRPRQLWLESYIADLLTHDVEQLDEPGTRKRDTDRLRRYFEAWALNSAGVLDHKRLFDAAGVTRRTADQYQELLTNLLIVERVPAWTSNRLKRLVHLPKRYVVDPALIAAALRMDEQGIMNDGDLLGRMIDTFVAAQLRPEIAVSQARPRLYHLRTQGGRHEIDLFAELAGERLIGIEIKAGAGPIRASDAQHLSWLRDQMGDRFLAGIVFHTGPQVYAVDEKITAAPIASLWGEP